MVWFGKCSVTHGDGSFNHREVFLFYLFQIYFDIFNTLYMMRATRPSTCRYVYGKILI